jgi:ribA/ribD-fused uncharacterized protein
LSISNLKSQNTELSKKHVPVVTMVKSKNPSGKVNTIPQPKARAEAAMAASKSAQSEDANMPIFFYMPNEVPYGVFCQWQRSWFTVPKSSFAYLNRESDLRRESNSSEEQLSTKLAATNIAESSGAPTTKASPIKSSPKGSPKLGPKKLKEEMITFNCAEQYMMYVKSPYFADHSSGVKILASRDPKEQKKLGRQVRGYNDFEWSQVRSRVGEEGNYAKFTQDERLKGLLLGTGERLLCEAAKRDAIWGIGMDAAVGIATWNEFGAEAEEMWGTNLLGKSIMAARGRIREEERRQRMGEKEKEETAQEKKVRNLNRKLRDIDALKKRRDAGEKLEDTQIRKIEGEDVIRKELEELGVEGVDALAEPLW